MKTLSYKARELAIQEHTKSNQTYNGEPYSFHLHQVATQCYHFLHLLASPEEEMLAGAGAYVHDLIEDCRLTYNDVAAATSAEVAEISYLLATPKGRNRAARHCDSYYQEIATNKVATFVKIADRLANAAYSKQTGGKMLVRYQQELPHFSKYLRPAYPEFEPMWVELEKLLA